MIDKTELISKLGKNGFVQFANQNRNRKEKTGAEKARQLKGKVWTQICEHGKIVVSQGRKTKFCPVCSRASRSEHRSIAIQVHDYEYFNVGTGIFGNESEHRKYAKQNGLRANG